MKRISIAALLAVIAACSAHPVKCRGHLLPINKPVASAVGVGHAHGPTFRTEPKP